MTRNDYSRIVFDPSNFSLIETVFGDMIVGIREQDREGRSSSGLCARKTYVFRNNTKLYITEYYRNGKIEHYFYDWFAVIEQENRREELLLGFHSESHTRDERYQTSTEPFHVHISERIGQRIGNFFRLPNFQCIDLMTIMEFIRFYMFASETEAVVRKKE